MVEIVKSGIITLYPSYKTVCSWFEETAFAYDVYVCVLYLLCPKATTNYYTDGYFYGFKFLWFSKVRCFCGFISSWHAANYCITGYFWSRNFCTTHDKLNFKGSIFIHFHFLASWINSQYNLEEFYFCRSNALWKQNSFKNYPLAIWYLNTMYIFCG